MTAVRPLRIGIDARYLSHRLVGGVHTYVAHVLPAVMAAGPQHTFLLYPDAKAPFELTPPDHALVSTLPWRHAASSVWNDWVRLERRMARDTVDVAFFPANHGFGPASAATVVTVHDAINLLPLRETLWSPGYAATLRSCATMVYLRAVTGASARRATGLITMSGYSRDAIVRASGRAVEDITVVHHGAPPTIAVSDADRIAVLRTHGIEPPYVLADGLKNPGVVVRAAARLAAAGGPRCTFVFFARHARVLPVLASAVAGGAATLLVQPATPTLAALYAGAAAFAFPSWVEGFGIPLLEAMQYGVPIVASDRGSIPEVAGDAAVIIDAEDDAALAAALTGLLTDAAAADHLRSVGRARVATFTWRRSGERTLAALEAAYDRRHATSGDVA